MNDAFLRDEPHLDIEKVGCVRCVLVVDGASGESPAMVLPLASLLLSSDSWRLLSGGWFLKSSRRVSRAFILGLRFLLGSHSFCCDFEMPEGSTGIRQ